jgi:Fungal N-terminal domain of STAND proteins
MDPLSISFGVVGSLGVVAHAANRLIDFVETVKDAPDDIQAIKVDAITFHSTLVDLQKWLGKGVLQKEAQNSLKPSVQNSQDVLNELNTLLQSCTKTSDDGKTRELSKGVRWALKKGDLAKLRDRLHQCKVTLDISLNVISL